MTNIAEGIIGYAGPVGAEAWVENNIRLLLGQVGQKPLEEVQSAVAYQMELLQEVRKQLLAGAF